MFLFYFILISIEIHFILCQWQFVNVADSENEEIIQKSKSIL